MKQVRSPENKTVNKHVGKEFQIVHWAESRSEWN
jgi:hypothetical protein